MLRKISIMPGKLSIMLIPSSIMLLACDGNHGMCGESFFFFFHYLLKQFNEQQQSVLETSYVETAVIVRYNHNK